MWEYHKKAMELMDPDMRAMLKTLYSEEGYKAKAKEITDNRNTDPDMEAGRSVGILIRIQSLFDTVTESGHSKSVTLIDVSLKPIVAIWGMGDILQILLRGHHQLHVVQRPGALLN